MGNLKIMRLSDSAFRLWVKGLCYCQTHLTDGLIPREWLREVRAKRGDVDFLSSVIVDGKSPLWERIEGFGFKCHDYLSWNDCREKVLERQADAKARRDAYDAKKRAAKAGTPTRSERVPDASENASITKPNQTKEELERESAPRAHAATVFDGSLPRDHRDHVFCDPTFSVCVPPQVHRKFLGPLSRRYAGDRQKTHDALKAWYARIAADLPPETVMGDAFKFWQPRFDAAFATPAPVGPPRDADADTRALTDGVREILRKQGAL